MTLFLIAASAAATLVVDDPVVAAADVGLLRTAAETVVRAGDLYRSVDAAVATATEQARVDGHARGYANGLAAASAEASAALLAQNLQLVEERRRLRGDVTRLALEVVRRIAGEVGEAAMVAGLAEVATAEFLPDTVAVVRVQPAAVAAVAERLRGFAGLTVVGDAGIAVNDCLIETPLAISHASLDVQLAAVERTWATAAADGADGG